MWLDEVVPESAFVLRQHNLPGLLAGLQSAGGVTMMSDMVAAADENLMLCFSIPLDIKRTWWLSVRSSLCCLGCAPAEALFCSRCRVCWGRGLPKW